MPSVIRGDRAARRAVTQSHGKYLRRLDRLLRQVSAAIVPQGRTFRFKATQHRDEVVFLTALGFLAKAWKTVRSIRRLGEQGHSQDAHVLARALFETALRGVYVLQRDCRRRARLYRGYVVAKRAQMVQQWTRTPGLKRQATQRVRNLAATQVLEVAQALNITVEELKRESAVFGNLEELSKRLRMHQAYNTFYRAVSPAAHGGDVFEHVRITPDGRFILKLLPGGDQDLTRALTTAEFLLWMLASKFAHRFGLRVKKKLETVKPLMLQHLEARRQKRREARAAQTAVDSP